VVVPPSFGFAATVLESETWLVQQLDLCALRIEPSLAAADGWWKGARVRLETHVCAGGPIRYARFTRLVGDGLEIGNVLCMARPSYPVPILGADLVALGRGVGMLAADLSPTAPCGPERDRQLGRLRALRSRAPSLPPGGVLPAWCQAWFSPYALYTRVGVEQAPDAIRAYRAFPHVFVELVREAAPDPALLPVIEVAQAGYARAHRSDDIGLRLLGKMFGESWAQRYIDQVLFPAPSDVPC
jgi:phycocyanobilin:ferredoxin oxidoreductase